MGNLSRRVVRGWAANKTHVVDVPASLLVAYEAFGAPFTGITPPLVAQCGTRVSGRVAVCMKAGTPVRCRPCAHATGLAAAPADNEALR